MKIQRVAFWFFTAVIISDTVFTELGISLHVDSEANPIILWLAAHVGGQMNHWHSYNYISLVCCTHLSNNSDRRRRRPLSMWGDTVGCRNFIPIKDSALQSRREAL